MTAMLEAWSLLGVCSEEMQSQRIFRSLRYPLVWAVRADLGLNVRFFVFLGFACTGFWQTATPLEARMSGDAR